MHEKTKKETKRIYSLVHDFCREIMKNSGCGNCIIAKANVCNEDYTLSRLREAERLILEKYEYSKK